MGTARRAVFFLKQITVGFMRHRIKGRILGRKASHRHAMWRNMASSLILTVRPDEDAENTPKVAGRIITTIAKAKELRPYVERLVTIAKRGLVHEEEAARFGTSAAPNSAEWKTWRDSDQWNKWNQAIAPAVNARRKAFSLLRDKLAVEILFADVAPRFQYRPGGYTRILKLSSFRLGDAGQHAAIEFVGEHDRVRARRAAPVVKSSGEAAAAPAEGAAQSGAAPAEG
jgi:large subunit ribosomal protein L17